MFNACSHNSPFFIGYIFVHVKFKYKQTSILVFDYVFWILTFFDLPTKEQMAVTLTRLLQ